MTTVYYDPPFDDEARRNHLYEGDLIVLSPSKATLAFCQFAKELVKEAFAPLDPETAQYHLPVEKYAEILGKLKPTFIHHPETKNYMRNVLKGWGCDLEKTYYEVPKLRSSTSDGYLTTGIAYAWHPHRDTWTAALPSQINWWIPVYELHADNAMTFFPQYWDQARQKQLKRLQLLLVEPAASRRPRYQVSQGGPPADSSASGGDPDVTGDAPDMSGWRGDLVLRGASACERAEHVRTHSLQFRFQNRAARRHRCKTRRPKYRLGVQGTHASGLHQTDGSQARAGGIYGALRRRERADRRARLRAGGIDCRPDCL